MNRKTRLLYDKVMEKIIEVYDERYPDVYIKVENVMSDFEDAILGSVKQAFMGCETTGCFFHYGQVIYFFNI